MSEGVFQTAYEQLKTINTKDRRRVMLEERDLAETRKTSMVLDIGNQRDTLRGLEGLRDELERAIATKRSLLTESIATFESLVKVTADLDVQITKLEG